MVLTPLVLPRVSDPKCCYRIYFRIQDDSKARSPRISFEDPRFDPSYLSPGMLVSPRDALPRYMPDALSLSSMVLHKPNKRVTSRFSNTLASLVEESMSIPSRVSVHSTRLYIRMLILVPCYSTSSQTRFRGRVYSGGVSSPDS